MMVYDIATLSQQLRHVHRPHMTSTQRVHAHIRTRPGRLHTRRGAHRAPVFAIDVPPQNDAGTCVRVSKRSYPQPQEAPTKPKASPSASRRKVDR